MFIFCLKRIFNRRMDRKLIVGLVDHPFVGLLISFFVISLFSLFVRMFFHTSRLREKSPLSSKKKSIYLQSTLFLVAFGSLSFSWTNCLLDSWEAQDVIFLAIFEFSHIRFKLDIYVFIIRNIHIFKGLIFLLFSSSYYIRRTLLF